MCIKLIFGGYIDLLHRKYHDISILELAMFPYEIRGVDRLGNVGKSLYVGSDGAS